MYGFRRLRLKSYEQHLSYFICVFLSFWCLRASVPNKWKRKQVSNEGKEEITEFLFWADYPFKKNIANLYLDMCGRSREWTVTYCSHIRHYTWFNQSAQCSSNASSIDEAYRKAVFLSARIFPMSCGELPLPLYLFFISIAFWNTVITVVDQSRNNNRTANITARWEIT